MSRKETVSKSKASPKPIKLRPKKEPEAIEVPEDLQNLWQAVVAITTCHNMLQEGAFHYRFRNAVGVSLAFLEELQRKTLADASKHPRADLIPQIKKLMDERTELDGKDNKQN